MTKNILEEIQEEILRQNSKWGEQNHKGIEWMAILMEEVGEASKEIVDFHLKSNGQNESDECEQHLKNYRKELIQVAAVTVQMIDSLERNRE